MESKEAHVIDVRLPFVVNVYDIVLMDAKKSEMRWTSDIKRGLQTAKENKNHSSRILTAK